MPWMLAMLARDQVVIGEMLDDGAMRMVDGARLDVSSVKHFQLHHRDDACAYYFASRKNVFGGYMSALASLAQMQKKIGGERNFIPGPKSHRDYEAGRAWYRAGRKARTDGAPEADCPYEAGPAENEHPRYSWLCGWHHANGSTPPSAPRPPASSAPGSSMPAPLRKRALPPTGTDAVEPSGWTAAQLPVALAIQDDGRGAYLLGEAFEACPYADGTMEATCWITGYEMQEMLGAPR